MSEPDLIALIKNHLDSFSANVSRNIDHLLIQYEKIAQQTIEQDRRIDRLEILFENSVKEHDRQYAELSEIVKTSTKNISEIALSLSNLDHDRRKFAEDIDTIYHKMDVWQRECTQKYEDAAHEIRKTQSKVNKIYWYAIGVGSAAATIINVAVKLVK